MPARHDPTAHRRHGEPPKAHAHPTRHSEPLKLTGGLLICNCGSTGASLLTRHRQPRPQRPRPAVLASRSAVAISSARAPGGCDRRRNAPRPRAPLQPNSPRPRIHHRVLSDGHLRRQAVWMARLWQDIEVQRDGNTVTLRVSDQNAAVVRGPGSGSDISSSARSTSFSSTLSGTHWATAASPRCTCSRMPNWSRTWLDGRPKVITDALKQLALNLIRRT